MSGLQNQLASKEAYLRELKTRLSEAEDSAPTAAADPNDIGSLRRQLADLMMRYTPNHPDVVRLQNRIKKLENAPVFNADTGQMSTGGVSRRKSMLLRDQELSLIHISETTRRNQSSRMPSSA